MLEYTIDPVRAKEAVENALARLGLTKHWPIAAMNDICIVLVRPVRVRFPNTCAPEESSITVNLNVDAICRIDAMDGIEGGGALDDYIERELHK